VLVQKDGVANKCALTRNKPPKYTNVGAYDALNENAEHAIR